MSSIKLPQLETIGLEKSHVENLEEIRRVLRAAKAAIETNETGVATNLASIVANIADIATNAAAIAVNAAAIAANASAIAANASAMFKHDGSVAMTGNVKLNGNYLSGDGGDEGVYVGTDGKVGVGIGGDFGTTAPAVHLDVRDSTATAKMFLTRLDTGVICEASARNTKVYVGAKSAHDLMLITDLTERVFVDGSTGDVGIGAASTGAKLYVSGDLETTSGCDVGGALTVTGTSKLTGNVGIGAASTGKKLYVSGTAQFTGAVDCDSTFNADGNSTLGGTLSVTGTSQLTGNVGVGAASTAKKLYVSGTMQCTGAVDLDSTLNVDGSATVAAVTASGAIRGNGGFVSSLGNAGATGTFNTAVHSLIVFEDGLIRSVS
jgi:cytoskeletal protein CcmA (bactofilin family)